jgi:hypothetical protein
MNLLSPKSLFLSAALVALPAARAQSGCTGPDGNRFNLEPRPNAVVQTALSVAMLPNRVAPAVDLVVATAYDGRALDSSLDGYYVQRSGGNCQPDFEGGLPAINNEFNPSGTPTAISDPARDAFFIVDLRSRTAPDQNAVGILRTTSANLLSSTACPGGTQTTTGSTTCWPTGTVVNVVGADQFLTSPHIAVDPRQTGSATGAGDLYTVVTELMGSDTSIVLNACTNHNLNCSNPIVISGGDLNADFSFVQVRPDGLITVSYRNLTSAGPEDIMFVTCTPNGAPAAPTCGSPQLVTAESNPVGGLIGDLSMDDQIYPRHVNRQESDGTTFTTFLVYDRCDVPLVLQVGEMVTFCPKTDVVVTSSTDAGASWSPITKVSASAGQQFFGTVALDTSTNTVNLGYYSTENDRFQLRPQVFLAQIAPGTTTVEEPHLLTSAFGDVQASPPIVTFGQPVAFGDRLGIAANGTGVSGQSRAYLGFTWDSVFGVYAGVNSADVNNHLTNLQY